MTLRVHPDQGQDLGARMRLKTAHGMVTVTITHDIRLRPDVLDLPAQAGALFLLDETAVDPLTGAPVKDGLSGSLDKA